MHSVEGSSDDAAFGHRQTTNKFTTINREFFNNDESSADNVTVASSSSFLPGEGLRRRKVINAAKETLDKGKLLGFFFFHK